MIKEVSIGLTGLILTGGIGTASGFYGQSALEWVSDLLEKGSGVTYTIKTDSSSDTKELVCEGQSGKYASLKLGTIKDWALKARLSCEYLEVKKDYQKEPLKTTLDAKPLTCNQEGITNSFLCTYTDGESQPTKTVELVLESNPPQSITITLKKK
ncbi:hypothetical protein MHLP_01310 [Candidatus Mycoplasma haematolamae str. Purdue]|uniref:Uncharacterized protein n=1 Tax=Mycoplasma haematolamae (strain Purdue) TaxID=1212765 RepID=I7C5Q1_MYCHA|nr:hypothetical protein [Candidatus Mycoplasma haematolamae]AFO51842.1 hypothetical protein MHLP_01310 [Candidatus Mycoplasma haematolamae str. Purdue]